MRQTLIPGERVSALTVNDLALYLVTSHGVCYLYTISALGFYDVAPTPNVLGDLG